jgi:hypothetical protein
MKLVSATLACLLAASCGSGNVTTTDDTGLDGLALESVAPATLVPGSHVVVKGRSFVDAPYGTTRLHLVGTFGASSAPVDVQLDAAWIDYDELSIAWPGGGPAGLGGDDGTFTGEATVEVDSTIDHAMHASPALPLTLEVRASLEPRVDALQTGVIFVNDAIEVDGDGFLLGGDEGETVAVVDGCYQPDGAASCTPITPRKVPAVPETPFDRTRVTFAFVPEIAGIQPGHFEGTVRLENHHGADAGELVTTAPDQPAAYDMVPPRIFSFSPTAASLGQYVFVDGGGFVGLPPESPDQTSLVTLIHFQGTFTPAGGSAVAVDLTLVPQFESGRRVRYVLNEDDDLGQRVDLRKVSGTFTGTATPVIQQGTDEVVGDPSSVTLSIARVKQVVWLNFLPSYVESLRHFGLRALDAKIRARVLAVAKRDYQGVNVEFRLGDAPTDFAYYEEVDIAGPDPNGLGLFGYDNSPGKDTGNTRLYDKIGGVNATTQQDGYPGYGGVFVESFFGFSMHPNGLAMALKGGQTDVFDAIFDPFRPDRGGHPVLAADVAGGIDDLTDGSSCPAAKGDRSGQAACAVWVLGSMIGTTMTHEVGHSLGLANPGEDMAFHDVGDQPNRLMDAGGARTFNERAELMGEGPARFCDMEYTYLVQILPSDDPPSTIDRPGCF